MTDLNRNIPNEREAGSVEYDRLADIRAKLQRMDDSLRRLEATQERAAALIAEIKEKL